MGKMLRMGRDVMYKTSSVPLPLIFLEGSNILGVAIGEPGNHNRDVHSVGNKDIADSVAEAAASHGGELGGDGNDHKLADLGDLEGDDRRHPRVGLDLTHVKENRLGQVALNLLLSRLLEEVFDEVPERKAGGAVIACGLLTILIFFLYTKRT
jgi:hypothetical protein